MSKSCKLKNTGALSQHESPLHISPKLKVSLVVKLYDSRHTHGRMQLKTLVLRAEFTVLGTKMIYSHSAQALTPAETSVQQGEAEHGYFALP